MVISFVARAFPSISYLDTFRECTILLMRLPHQRIRLSEIRNLYFHNSIYILIYSDPCSVFYRGYKKLHCYCRGNQFNDVHKRYERHDR